MVVMDHFSNIIMLVPLQSIDVNAVADNFFCHVFSQHGLPQTIMADWDLRFMAKLWQELIKAHGTALYFSTVHYPQTDSMAEVTNCTMEQLLQIQAMTIGWVAMLLLVAMMINAMLQS